MEHQGRQTIPRHGDRLEVAVHDVASDGRGVGRTPSGLVVMTRGAVPGDQILVEVTGVHRSRVEARLVTVIRPSPDRVQPVCEHFGNCGGCALQNLAVNAQRRLKARRVKENLRRIAGLSSVAVDAVVAVGPDYGFRDRMEFAFGAGPSGVSLGLHDLSREVFDLQECHLGPTSFSRMVGRVRELARRHDLRGGRGRSFPGLQRLDIRRTAEGGIMLVVKTGIGELPGAFLEDLAAFARTQNGPDAVVVRQHRPGHPSARAVLAGDGRLRTSLLGLEFHVPDDAFVQTQMAGAVAITRRALAWLAGEPAGALLDLYAGVGLLALAAAASRPVVAVEASASSVRAGREAARRAGRPLRFIRGDVRSSLRELVADGKDEFRAGAVNPPREGLHRDLPGLLGATAIERLVYVSCDPGTLARDLGRLACHGLQTVRVIPFDLFPQTARVEVLALLERRSAAGESGVDDDSSAK